MRRNKQPATPAALGPEERGVVIRVGDDGRPIDFFCKGLDPALAAAALLIAASQMWHEEQSAAVARVNGMAAD